MNVDLKKGTLEFDPDQIQPEPSLLRDLKEKQAKFEDSEHTLANAYIDHKIEETWIKAKINPAMALA